MSEAEKEHSSSDAKEEEYSWVVDPNIKNNFLKFFYIQFPFKEWEQIIKQYFNLNHIDDKLIYQEVVNQVLEIDVFKKLNFKKEKNGINLFHEFADILDLNLEEIKTELIKFIKERKEKERKEKGTKEKNDTKETIEKNDTKETTENTDIENIKPDFIVTNIEKNTFINLIQNRRYMFRSGIDLNSFVENILYINIIGEIKTNPDNLDKKQRNRYINFCEFMNSKVSDRFYLTLYIFNVSYVKFWSKNFHNKLPCIIGFIPKLHSPKKEYLLNYYYLLSQKDEIINTYKQNNLNEGNNEIIQTFEKGIKIPREKRELIQKKAVEDKNIEEKDKDKNIENDCKKKEIIGIIDIKEENNKEILEKQQKNKENKKIYITIEDLIKRRRIIENRMIAINRDIKDMEQKMEEEIENSNKMIKKETENINKVINYLKNLSNNLINKEKDKIKIEKRKHEDNILKKKRKLEDYEMEYQTIEKEIQKKSKDN